MKSIPVSFLLKVFFFTSLILTSLSASIYSQDYYSNQWKVVDSLLNYNLSESAEKIIDEVFIKAKSEDNTVNYIKSLLYKMRVIQYNREEFYKKTLNDWIEEEKNAQFPAKQFLNSVIADLYWSYFQQNKYNVLKRSETVNFNNDDIDTWDAKKFIDKIIYYYDNSLSETDRLKQVSIENYSDLLNKQYSKKIPEGRKFRPTLYDFLAHKAIDFYTNKEAGLTRPADQFALNDAAYLSDAKDFVNFDISTKDTYSFDFHAITLLKELMNFHLNDTDPAALIDVDLERLLYVYSNSSNADKEQLYEKALNNLATAYSSNPASAMVNYYLANYYVSLAKSYNQELSPDKKDYYKKALEICKSTINKFPDAPGSVNCQSLINQIQTKNLVIKTEAFLEPNKNFRLLVNYRNVSKVYFKIVETSFDEIEQFSKEFNKTYDYDKIMKELLKRLSEKNPVNTFSAALPDDGDYQANSLEVKTSGLNPGQYFLLAGTDENFSYNKNAIAYSFLSVTNISYINKKLNSGDEEFYILNREKGTALSDATVKVVYTNYNYNKSEYEDTPGSFYNSDDNGYFVIKSPKKNSTFYLDINYQGERLYTKPFTLGYGYINQSEGFYLSDYSYETESKPYLYTQFFTDRSIYRPGQTIFFKGITIQVDKKNKTIKPNTNIEVGFYDVNQQLIENKSFTTNEFGTFNGTFTAPLGGLTGQMSISVNYGTGSAYVQVEEYKRPKFEATFLPIKDAYKLNEMVTLQGNAKSYSGANLDNAKVSYRVVRKTLYPKWYYYWYDYYFPNNTNETEIINGTTVTNNDGDFTINFKALPDVSVSKDLQPNFYYQITADVTDINGETHSAMTNVSAGYRSLLLNIAIPDNVDKNFENKFSFSTTNLNGQRVPATGDIMIYKLKSPDRVYRERYWEKPTKFIYTKEEFQRDLPYDEFNDETDFTKWEKDFKAYETEYNSTSDSFLYIPDMKNWNQGKYVIEMTGKDAFGEIVTDKFYFDAYSTGETTMPYKTFANLIKRKTYVEPGNNAEFIFGTSTTDTRVLFETGYKDGLIKREWLTLNDEQRFFTIPIKEDYRGNIYYSLTFIRHNRIFTESDIISVPYTNKELNISFETFRDKLLPGENEEWKINIKGKLGDKVAAEMLASMYDASLDALKHHYWSFNILDYFYNQDSWKSNICFQSKQSSIFAKDWNTTSAITSITYDEFNYFNAPIFGSSRNMYNMTKDQEEQNGRLELSPEVVEKNMETEKKEKKPTVMKNGITNKGDESSDEKKNEFSQVSTRKDFRETVFFMPELYTNENGDVTLKFQMPDALTKWKMMGFAVTKDLKFGMVSKEIITQKDLMITPNLPRYFREDDKVVINTKIDNLSGKELEGDVMLSLFDPATNKDVNDKFKVTNNIKPFKVAIGKSDNVSFDIQIPYGFDAVNCKIVAKAGDFSDGEEKIIPVITNRMMVTETMPMYIRGSQTKNFTLDKLVNSTSSTAYNYRLSLEFTSNPAWYAIQSLPYLMEYPYECAEQVFSRLYANSIATNIVNSSPKIKEVFDKWKNQEPSALLSNLEKNEELKSLILQETPWVRDAHNENEQKRRIGMLFELNIMRMELDRAVRKLKSMQVSNGAWPWFEGMPEDRFITQHIIAGLGKLNKLGIRKISESGDVYEMVELGLNYMDTQIENDYKKILERVERKETKLSDNNLSYIQMHYLYTRSFFLKEFEIPSSSKEAVDYFIGQSKKYWTDRGWYGEGMIALYLNRFDSKDVPKLIVQSLKENSLYSDEMGMYWKNNVWGYYWYEAPIETQALLIEVFDEVANDSKAVDDMKVWLLKQKQTTNWKTTKATVEAVYALILKGDDWLSTEDLVEISIGSQKLIAGQDYTSEAGTGYFKKSWSWGEIKPEMGNVTVSRKSNEGISWGALYWQYFEDLDKITKAETNLKVDKKLFLEQQTSTGPVITPIEESTVLKPGDLVKVRIEIRTDRNMEYVHLKDMRAAGFEPVNIISSYKYQEGLGYYESTRDAATNFFISYLPKGTYVFEYPLRVNLPGEYSNGITSLQCMYAPEFSSHSEGIRVKINQ